MDAQNLEYSVTVHHEDGAYWAEVAELPGCFAAGDTEAELWEALAEAVSLYLSTPDSTITVTGLERTVVSESFGARVLVG